MSDILERNCANCETTDSGKFYKFYFGKYAGSKTTYRSDGFTITGSYVVGGDLEVFICNKCVQEKRRKIDLKRSLVVYGLLLLLGITGLTVHRLSKSKLVFMEVSGVVMASIGFLGLVIPNLFDGVLIKKVNEHVDAGHNLAIETCKADYILNGYDTFWSPKQYAKLKAKPK